MLVSLRARIVLQQPPPVLFIALSKGQSNIVQRVLSDKLLNPAPGRLTASLFLHSTHGVNSIQYLLTRGIERSPTYPFELQEIPIISSLPIVS
jgi:hypothetical protein